MLYTGITKRRNSDSIPYHSVILIYSVLFCNFLTDSIFGIILALFRDILVNEQKGRTIFQESRLNYMGALCLAGRQW